MATTNSKHNYSVSPNLLNRDFSAAAPNTKWVGDITYIPTDEGWLYAAIVKDPNAHYCYDHRIELLSVLHHRLFFLFVSQTMWYVFHFVLHA